MKNIIYLLIFFSSILVINAQKNSFLDVDLFYGVVLEHDKSLQTAIQGNPFGIILGYNLKNKQEKKWLAYYNYPDFGFSAVYQNTNSTSLGKMYGLYTHYNFYLNNRNSKNKLQLRIALGLGYITNPYNAITNENNFTLSTKFAGSAYLKLNYNREFLQGKFGLQTGISLIHFSNAAFKNPNLGINTLAVTLGFNYNLSANKTPFPKKIKTPKDTRKLRYNLIFRTGLNESKIPNSGQFPFYIGTFQIEKKLNFKSTLSSGIDYFKAEFLKPYLQQQKELETGIPDASHYKTDRIGLFIGHELYLHNFSLVSQIGYNIYAPNIYISNIYERVGLKHHFNDHFFTELTLKLNLFRAEGLEFGIGYRL